MYNRLIKLIDRNGVDLVFRFARSCMVAELIFQSASMFRVTCYAGKTLVSFFSGRPHETEFL